ncbi:MAG: hypothetical protein K0S10_936, partial [Rubrobacteraceae bacterium]|nr:hypothetical protein [Rubrobacteraceae bacterium]
YGPGPTRAAAPNIMERGETGRYIL